MEILTRSACSSVSSRASLQGMSCLSQYMVEYTVAASPRKMSFHLPGPSSLMTLTDAYWGFDELDVPSNSLTFLSVKHSGPKRCGSLVLSRLMIALRDSENMSANPSRSVTFFSTSMPQTREMTPNGMSGTGLDSPKNNF